MNEETYIVVGHKRGYDRYETLLITSSFDVAISVCNELSFSCRYNDVVQKDFDWFEVQKQNKALTKCLICGIL